MRSLIDLPAPLFLLVMTNLLGQGECWTYDIQKSAQLPSSQLDYKDINFGFEAHLLESFQKVSDRTLRRRDLKKSSKRTSITSTSSSKDPRSSNNHEFLEEDVMTEFEDMFGTYISEDSADHHHKSGKKTKNSKKGKGHVDDNDNMLSMDFSIGFSMEDRPERSGKYSKGEKKHKASKKSTAEKGAPKLTRSPSDSRKNTRNDLPTSSPNDSPPNGTPAPIISPISAPTQPMPTDVGTDPEIDTDTDLVAVPTLQLTENGALETPNDDTAENKIDTEPGDISPNTRRDGISIVEFPSYEILYFLEDSGIPLRGHYIELTEMTEDFLQEHASGAFGSENLLEMKTEFDSSALSSTGPTIVAFLSTAYFDNSSPVPSASRIQELISGAFSGESKMQYISLLQELRGDNVFSSTIDMACNSASGSSGARSGSSTPNTTGIVVGATMGVLAISLSLCVFKRQRESCLKREYVKNEGTVMSMTVGSVTVAETQASNLSNAEYIHSNGIDDEEEEAGQGAAHCRKNWPVVEQQDTCPDSLVYTPGGNNEAGECDSINTSVRAAQSFESTVTAPSVRFSLNSFERAWREDDIDTVSGHSIHSQSISERWDGTTRTNKYPWQSSTSDGWRKVSANDLPIHQEETAYEGGKAAKSFSLSLSQDIKQDLETAGLLENEEMESDERSTASFTHRQNHTLKNSNSVDLSTKQGEDQTTTGCNAHMSLEAPYDWHQAHPNQDRKTSQATSSEDNLFLEEQNFEQARDQVQILVKEEQSRGFEYERCSRNEKELVEARLAQVEKKAQLAEKMQGQEEQKLEYLRAALLASQNEKEEFANRSERELLKLRQQKEEEAFAETERRRASKDQLGREKSAIEEKLKLHYNGKSNQLNQKSFSRGKNSVFSIEPEQARQAARQVLKAANEAEWRRNRTGGARGRGSQSSLKKRLPYDATSDGAKMITKPLPTQIPEETSAVSGAENHSRGRVSSKTELPEKPRQELEGEVHGLNDERISPTETTSSQCGQETAKKGTLRGQDTDGGVRPKTSRNAQAAIFIAPWSERSTLGERDQLSVDSTHCAIESGETEPNQQTEERERIYKVARSMNKLHLDEDDPWWCADERSVTRRNRSSFKRPHYSRVDDIDASENDGVSDDLSQSASSHNDTSSSRSGYI